MNVQKVLEKCQLREAIQEKEGGLDSLGMKILCVYKLFKGLIKSQLTTWIALQLHKMDQTGAWDRDNYFVWDEPC